MAQHNYFRKLQNQKNTITNELVKQAREALDLDGDGKVSAVFTDDIKRQNDTGKNTLEGKRFDRVVTFIKGHSIKGMDFKDAVKALTIADLRYNGIYTSLMYDPLTEEQRELVNRYNKLDEVWYNAVSKLNRINSISKKFGSDMVSFKTSHDSITVIAIVKKDYFTADSGVFSLASIKDSCGLSDYVQIVSKESDLADSDTVAVRLSDRAICDVVEEEKDTDFAKNGDINIYVRADQPGDDEYYGNGQFDPNYDFRWIENLKESIEHGSGYKMTVADKVQALFDSEISVYQIAKDTNLSQPSLSKIKKDRSKVKNMHLETAETLASYYDSLKWRD